MDRFILIDGNAIIHRAYHALPPLTSKKGEVANAVYGFFSMFLKILGDLKPSFLAVCFDKAAPTFRQELYVGYQAQRPKMADELVPQIKIIHDILEKAKVAIFEVDGYEADDLIGTLAVQVLRAEVALASPDGAEVAYKNFLVHDAKKLKGLSRISKPASVHRENFVGSSRLYDPDLEVIIVSGDRDMLQLVNSHVKVLAPVIGITNMVLYDSGKVEEKYGIKPSQIIDYKALVGDPSDNYPGVSGIGPKTAKDLLNKYGSFENLYTNIKDLPSKISEKLANDAEQASLAKKLATIVTDAPISLDLQKCSFSKFDTKNLLASFEELGFKSLVKRVQNNGINGSEETPLRPSTSLRASAGQAKKKETQNNKQLGLL